MKQMYADIRVARFWLALTFGLVPASFALAQGTIVYHQPAAPVFGLVGQEVDVNGDGQSDLRFYNASFPPASYYATAASGLGSSRLFVTPNGGVDGGSYLLALSAGFLVGGPTNNALLWAGQDAPNSYGSATVLGSYIPEDISGSLVPVGYFYGTTAFMGVQFQIASEWHYGWVRIRGGTAGVADDGQFYLNPPGWVLDWAYETRANTPIFAGAGVPEPSISVLIAIGILTLTIQRRRKSL